MLSHLVILGLVERYYPILAFFGGLIIGELFPILGILSGVGKANFFIIILIGFIGEIIHDSGMYFIANSKMAYFIKKKFKLSKRKIKIEHYIERLGNGNYFLAIFLAKFIYGVRDAVIIYVAHKKKNLKEFLMNAIPAGLCSITVITFVGWLAGRGFSQLLLVIKGIEKWLSILLGSIIIVYILYRMLIYILSKKAR